jgi:histidine triad (HIT) family protein
MLKIKETKEKTIFEKIVAREIPAQIIAEDDKNIAFLDAFAFDKGHTLVIPKFPHKDIFKMPEKEFLDLQKFLLKVATHISEKTKKDIAIYQRNGKGAGQEVPHVHFHILPRYSSEKENPIFNDTHKVNSPYKDADEKEFFFNLLKF